VPPDPDAGVENARTLDLLREELRVDVDADDLLVDLARRMKTLGVA
jgi:hypothetical protein